jgi:two-component sensor histidine kinase
MMRELNHRTNNNFQIIVSLLSLKKRMVTPDRRDDLRFIEEHVLCLSVAHRLVYASGEMIDVPVSDLIVDVVHGLRQIAGLPYDQVPIEVQQTQARIGLDQAIALALYLASLLPPYLDHANANGNIVLVRADIEQETVTLAICASGSDAIGPDPLRAHLMSAFGGHLNAETSPSNTQAGRQIRFKLEPAGLAVFGHILDKSAVKTDPP